MVKITALLALVLAAGSTFGFPVPKYTGDGEGLHVRDALDARRTVSAVYSFHQRDAQDLESRQALEAAKVATKVGSKIFKGIKSIFHHHKKHPHIPTPGSNPNPNSNPKHKRDLNEELLTSREHDDEVFARDAPALHPAFEERSIVESETELATRQIIEGAIAAAVAVPLGIHYAPKAAKKIHAAWQKHVTHKRRSDGDFERFLARAIHGLKFD